MVLGLVVAVVSAAAPLKVASTPWTHAGVEAAVVASLEARFASLLVERGLSVITPRDIEAMLGFERQKQLLGCADESSCTAELGGALGVDAILYGSVVKVGSSTTANLRVISTKDAQSLFTSSERLKGDDALQDWLDAAARRLAGELIPRGGDARPSLVVASTPGPSRFLKWVPAVVGGALAVTGALFFVQGRATADRLRTTVFPSPTDAHLVRLEGEGQQQLAVGLWGAGAAGIVASVAWSALTPSPVAVTVAPLPGGAVLGFTGALP